MQRPDGCSKILLYGVVWCGRFCLVLAILRFGLVLAIVLLYTGTYDRGSYGK